MRFLFIYSKCNVGGIGSAFKNRINALTDKGHYCKFIFYSSGVGQKNYTNIDYEVTNKRKRIAEIIQTENFDIVDFINVLPDTEIFKNIKYEGIILFEVRGIRRYHKKQANASINCCVDGVITPSEFVKRNIVEKFNPKPQVFCMTNMVDTSLFNLKTKSECLENGIVDIGDKSVIGWVGRIGAEGANKNWELFIKLLNHLSKNTKFRFEGWLIVDFSQSSNIGGLIKRIADNGLKAKIRVFDAVPHITMPYFFSYFANNKGCLISTSKTEGCQNSVLEAMACKCPVISTKSGGNEELIYNGYNGMLFSDNNWKKAIDYIKLVMNNMSFRTVLTNNGLEYVEKYHSPLKLTDDFLNICKILFSQKRFKTLMK